MYVCMYVCVYVFMYVTIAQSKTFSCVYTYMQQYYSWEELGKRVSCVAELSLMKNKLTWFPGYSQILSCSCEEKLAQILTCSCEENLAQILTCSCEEKLAQILICI